VVQEEAPADLLQEVVVAETPVQDKNQMFKYVIYLFIALSAGSIMAQNDLDAIRYSRTAVNGSSRFTAMGGAFGALGADLSCAANNPAGLALFKRGEIAFGFGIKTTHNTGIANNASSSVDAAKFVYNNFGISQSWTSMTDKDSRHIVAFTNTQIQNFNNSAMFSSYTNSTSIAQDMLNAAGQTSPTQLNSSYEGLAFNVYVLDTFQNKYFSWVDLKKTVLQNRQIVTAGRVNELNFSYAYAYKDKYYIGGSIGIPRVTYTSTTTHSESDNKDSMTVTVTSPTTFSTTYSSGLPGGYYPDKLGFNSLSYQEFFYTTGNGINLKLGGVVRLNDQVRIGFHYHTATLYYNLRDTYYNTMTSTFDKDKNNVISAKNPPDGGYFDYKITTPSRAGISSAFIIGKICAIDVEYELINYKKAQLSSSNASDFAGVNSVISHKYSYASNVRAGVEFNVKPVMLRAGYNMQGSPFGNVFTGSFVRNTVSVGLGLRSKTDVYFDVVWLTSFSKEDYYMFTTINQRSQINYSYSQLGLTLGKKF
jgi:hypothetical protein